MSTHGPAPDNLTPDSAVLAETGQVVIRLHQGITTDTPDLLQLAQNEGLDELEQFLTANRDIRSERVIRHVAPAVIREREAIAARSDYPALKSLASYWRLDASSRTDVESVRQALANTRGIELAYYESNVIEAGPNVSSNPYQANQHILDAAPAGIDARSAWQRVNGMGQGVNVIDVEMGWITGHQDLPKFTVLYGSNGYSNNYVDGNHGAAALGVVGAQNNSLGVIGIAPYLASLNVASHYDAASDSNMHVADAIDAATKYLRPGDILYIEVQRSQNNKAYPVEINSPDLHAIRHASAQGIIVIEAAGNWSQNNLDDWVDPTGEHSLKVGAELFTDSGAIMVGACSYPVVTDPLGYAGHTRYYRSNFGSRLDCYAWAEMNWSCGYGTIAGASGTTDSYTNNFGETSAATAIVAGAAAVVQSWYKSWCGSPLTPSQMRSILSNPGSGTRQANINGEPIGVMPDLNAIMTCRRRFIQVLLCVLGRIARPRRLDLREFDAYKLAIPTGNQNDRKN